MDKSGIYAYKINCNRLFGKLQANGYFDNRLIYISSESEFIEYFGVPRATETTESPVCWFDPKLPRRIDKICV
jgi:hypothetical protein